MRPYRFGEWLIERELNRISRSGEAHHLEAKTMDVLVYLIEHHDRVVSTDELLDRVWPDRVVEQSSIHRRINQLRQALGDDPKTPTYIRTIVRRGYQAIAPVAPATGDTVEEISVTAKPLLWALAALAVIVVAVVVIWSYLSTLPSVSAVPIVREQLELKNWIQGPTRNPGNTTPTIAMSLRGDSIAFVSRNEQGESGLSLRRLRELEAEPISGTEGADKPFFSPDGKWIGYFVGPTMMRIATSGGEPLDVMKLNRDSWGASWGSDDRIVFSDTTTGLSSVSLQGDDVLKLTVLDESVGEYSHRLPRHLHGHDSLLFTVYNQELGQQIWVLDFKTGERRYLFDGVAASYVDPGFIVYTKLDENLFGQLWFVPFDPKALAVTGEPLPVHGAMGGYMGTAFAASQAGPLVLLPRQGRLVGELVVREPDGSERILDRGPVYQNPQFSSDSRAIAVSAREAGKKSAIWVYDTASGSRTIFAEDNAWLPLWGPDDQSLLYNQIGVGLVQRSMNGRPAPEILVAHDGFVLPIGWNEEGQELLYLLVVPTQDGVLHVRSRDGSTRVIATPRWGGPASVTRDRRWIAWCTWPSGVAVGELPDVTALSIASESGCMPHWSADGRRLYYQSRGQLWWVETEVHRHVRFGERRAIADFGTPEFAIGLYDVDAVGRIVYVRHAHSDVTPPVILLNWWGNLR